MKKKKRGRKGRRRKNKKKIFKGFTMVELLTAMAIMGLLVIMAFPVIRAIQINNRNTKFEEYGRTAISASKLYTDSYGEDLFEPDVDNQFKTITFSDMAKKDLIKDINMEDATCINDSSVVVVKYKDDYAHCLHLVCKSKKSSVKLYEEKNRKGSCATFKTIKITYIYLDNGIERKAEKEIIKGEEFYKILSPSQVGFDLSKNHEALDYWEEVGGGRTFKPGDVIKEKILSNLTLRAKTRGFSYTINYEKGMGNGNMEPTTCTYGKPCPLRANSFSKDYYNFDHWTDKNNSTRTYSNGAEVKDSLGNITSDGVSYTLVAYFKKNKTTVTYNTNGGYLDSEHGATVSVSGSRVLVGGSEIIHTLLTGEKLGENGLIDWNNKTYLNIKKSGYSIKAGEEWKPTSGGATIIFNQKTQYTAEELCPNLKTGNCTVNLSANWSVSAITCAAGTYLPANKSTCADCTSGYYCPGGTWNVSTSIQGRNNCPTGYGNSPAKSSVNTQCYMSVAKNKYVKKAKDSSATACPSGTSRAAHNVNYGGTSSCAKVPTCSITADRKPFRGSWYKANVGITMTTTGSPTSYGIDSKKNSTNGKLKMTASTEGKVTYYGYVANGAGSNSCSITINLDKSPPVLSKSWSNAHNKDGWSYFYVQFTDTAGLKAIDNKHPNNGIIYYCYDGSPGGCDNMCKNKPSRSSRTYIKETKMYYDKAKLNDNLDSKQTDTVKMRVSAKCGRGNSYNKKKSFPVNLYIKACDSLDNCKYYTHSITIK